MTADELEASLAETPLTEDEMSAIALDMATLEQLEVLDEPEFNRIMEQTPCLCVGRFVCTRCKVMEKLA